MLPRNFSLRSGVFLTLVALIAALFATALVSPSGARPVDRSHPVAKAKTDPRKTQGLFVDRLMPAANQGSPYARAIGKKGQPLWIIPEAYPTSKVRGIVRAYTSRALKAKKTPMLSIYGIPDRDCGGESSAGALKDAAAYRAWIRKIGKGVSGQKAILILEPDALPFYGNPDCDHAGNRLGMLSYASKTLSKAGAWVYIDAGHSNWTPYDDRALLLKKAGVQYARGFSTNVSNFRPTSDEQTYAKYLIAGLVELGIKGKHYVIDTSRNGVAPTSEQGYDVLNPTWARVGKPPKLVFDGAFDGTLWVKHPGESDGYVNGGNASGTWCDLLADRLLGRPESGRC